MWHTYYLYMQNSFYLFIIISKSVPHVWRVAPLDVIVVVVISFPHFIGPDNQNWKIHLIWLKS